MTDNQLDEALTELQETLNKIANRLTDINLTLKDLVDATQQNQPFAPTPQLPEHLKNPKR